MKNYIEALITREKARFDQVTEKQKQANSKLESLRKENQNLISEACYYKEKIDFLSQMLKEESEDA